MTSAISYWKYPYGELISQPFCNSLGAQNKAEWLVFIHVFWSSHTSPIFYLNMCEGSISQSNRGLPESWQFDHCSTTWDQWPAQLAIENRPYAELISQSFHIFVVMQWHGNHEGVKVICSKFHYECRLKSNFKKEMFLQECILFSRQKSEIRCTPVTPEKKKNQNNMGILQHLCLSILTFTPFWWKTPGMHIVAGLNQSSKITGVK